MWGRNKESAAAQALEVVPCSTKAANIAGMVLVRHPWSATDLTWF